MCTCHLGFSIPKYPYSGAYIISLSFDVALASRGSEASQRAVWLILWTLQRKLMSEARVRVCHSGCRDGNSIAACVQKNMGLETNMSLIYPIREFGNSATTLFSIWYSKKRPILVKFVSIIYWVGIQGIWFLLITIHKYFQTHICCLQTSIPPNCIERRVSPTLEFTYHYADADSIFLNVHIH